MCLPSVTDWDEVANTQTFVPKSEGMPEETPAEASGATSAEFPLETTAVDVPPEAVPAGEAPVSEAEEPLEAVPAGRLGGIIESLMFASGNRLYASAGAGLTVSL